ncbi:MAG: hypothetical protein K2N07_10435, partial [Desulfovibrio sp.]|nr:hypothetical protein [Desulfovibrio sp.]
MDATLPTTQTFPRLLFFASVAVLFLLFCSECFLVLHTQAWRHDSFLYIPSYYGNLVSEGRWLNYLLFPLLQHFPPHLALALSFAALGYFSWSVARQLTDRRGALLFALAALQLPSIWSLFGWPLIPLSAYLLLAAAAYLARKLDYRLFFLLFGILFHGTLNNFYNLLIVLCIAPLRRGDLRLTALLIWYAAGFVAGYAATQLIILAVHGSFMQVAEWRRLNYPVSIPDAIRNLRLALGSLKDNLMILPDKALVMATVLFCMALSQWQPRASKRERERERERESLLLCLVLAAATYAQFFCLGLYVEIRTAFPLYLSLLCFPLLVARRHPRMFTVALLVIAVSYSLPNIHSLRYYQGVTSAYLEELAAITPHPERWKIIFLPDTSELTAVEDRLIALNGYKNSTNKR